MTTKNTDYDRDLLIDYFQNRCVRCHQPNITIHEITPKSLDPKNWADPANRVGLCYICHDWAHHQGTKKSKKELQTCLENYQKTHGTFEDWLGKF